MIAHASTEGAHSMTCPIKIQLGSFDGLLGIPEEVRVQVQLIVQTHAHMSRAVNRGRELGEGDILIWLCVLTLSIHMVDIRRRKTDLVRAGLVAS